MYKLLCNSCGNGKPLFFIVEELGSIQFHRFTKIRNEVQVSTDSSHCPSCGSADVDYIDLKEKGGDVI